MNDPKIGFRGREKRKGKGERERGKGKPTRMISKIESLNYEKCSILLEKKRT